MEHWRDTFFVEFEFYRNFSALHQDITDLLKENEMNIQLPMTRYEDDQMFYGCPNTEVQAINRIEREEILKKLQARAQKRIDRLLTAIEQLNEDERTILYYLEMEQGYFTSIQLLEKCNFKSITELMIAKDKALLKLSAIYSEDRKERETEFRRMLLEERREKVRKYIS